MGMVLYKAMVPKGLKLTDRSVCNFDIEEVLNSGQTFRHYMLEPGEIRERRYLVCSGKHASMVGQVENVRRVFKGEEGNYGIRSWCKAEEESFWEQFWGELGTGKFFEMRGSVADAEGAGEISQEAKRLLEFVIGYGEKDNLRILSQDWWETCVAFIMTSNNSILRVRNIMEKLCALYGDKDTLEGHEYYRLPGPDGILEVLKEHEGKLGLGFREKYLRSLCINARDREWSKDHLVSMGKAGAQRELMRVNGIGEKISDCIMLFGLGFGNVMPVDVWIDKALDVLKSYNMSVPQLESIFGENLGLFQQCLYVAMRSNALMKKCAENLW